MGKTIYSQCDKCKNVWVDDAWSLNNFESFSQITLDNEEEVCYTCLEEREDD